MGLKDIFKRKRKKKINNRNPRRRSYSAAAIGRLTNDWTTSSGTPDQELKAALRILRARSRNLVANNDYGKRFLNILKTNVVGAQGIGLQVRAKDSGGQLDVGANNMLESAFKDWGKVGSCTVDGKMSWIDCQKLFLETVAKDGEVIVKPIPGWKHNKYGFALQFIEADHLDENYSTVLQSGNEVRLGIEFDKWGRPVRYNMLKKHPGELLSGQVYHLSKYDQIPADAIIHKFLIERPRQSRGVPWMVTPMLRMKILDGYEEAELVASRTAASKMGFFKSPDGDGYTGDDQDDDEITITEAEPGLFEQLPAGVDFVKWDPDHPTTAFDAFSKSILRGIASGLNVSYVTLANDLEGVNYSSIRQGALDDRDAWRVLQTWIVEHFCQQIWELWLNMALTTGAVPLPPGKYEKFNNVIWRPRGWQWVDPDKEGKANERAVSDGFKSLQDVASEQGRDIADIFEALKNEKELAEQYGLKLPVFEGVKKNEKEEKEPANPDN